MKFQNDIFLQKAFSKKLPLQLLCKSWNSTLVSVEIRKAFRSENYFEGTAKRPLYRR